jgi:hypothetical protein
VRSYRGQGWTLEVAKSSTTVVQRRPTTAARALGYLVGYRAKKLQQFPALFNLTACPTRGANTFNQLVVREAPSWCDADGDVGTL